MVYMSESMSPSHFYLHKVAHTDSLDRLERDITDWAKQTFPTITLGPRRKNWS